MAEEDLAALQRQQDGVVSRRQVIEAGLTDSDIERKVRRREWARLHVGVFVDHTGRPTWEQRCWAAVLHFAPAVLGDGSALRAFGLRGYDRASAPIHVLVDRSRTIRPIAGVAVVSDAVQQGRTAAGRLVDALAEQPGVERHTDCRSPTVSDGSGRGGRRPTATWTTWA